MLLPLLSVIFLLANVVVLLHTYHQATRWGWGPKLALGGALLIIGQVTINILLVVLPNMLMGALPALGTNWPTAICVVVAGLWLGCGLSWICSQSYRRLGGAADAH